jgi:hypothetical protein
VITYTDPSVVTPPCYDTNSGSFQVLESENPFNAASSRYQVNFNDVPEEETTWRAAVIRVRACGDVTIRVKPGTEPGLPFIVSTPSVTSSQGPLPFREIRIWFQFTAGAVGTAPQSIPVVNTTLKCDENGQEFDFELKANSIERPTVAVQLVLDQSGSMAWAAGTSGATRLEVLKDAAGLFASLIQKNNGIGIIRFDQDAYPPDDPTYGGMAITKVLNDGFGDPTRIAALGVIATHGAHGDTSVGDGLEMGRNQLVALPAGSYKYKAMIVLTDGVENQPKSIADVSSSIDDRTFAVGLGNEAQVNTAALAALAGSTGGHLFLTGVLASSLDDQFRLRKFFLQILAGVTNTSIVRDPLGYISPGVRVRIPFELNEADINCRVILLTDFPVVRLAVETPDGKIIESGNAGSFGARFDAATNLTTSSFPLPLAFQATKIHGGTWYAILEIDKALYRKFLSSDQFSTHSLAGGSNAAVGQLGSKGAQYCVSIHSLSNLRMAANVTQSGFQPGASFYLRASLTEYGVPVEHRAAVRCEVEYPDHSFSVVSLAEAASGVFGASLIANMAGIYRLKFLAEGGTFRGVPFTREQIGTAAVWNGGDRPTEPPPTGGRKDTWCDLLSCLIAKRVISQEFEERLRKEGLNLEEIRRCLKAHCN